MGWNKTQRAIINEVAPSCLQLPAIHLRTNHVYDRRPALNSPEASKLDDTQVIVVSTRTVDNDRWLMVKTWKMWKSEKMMEIVTEYYRVLACSSPNIPITKHPHNYYWKTCFFSASKKGLKWQWELGSGRGRWDFSQLFRLVKRPVITSLSLFEYTV
jgi:hypothetical protein